MSNAFDYFKDEYNDFSERYKDFIEGDIGLPKDMAFLADLDMFANAVSSAAKSAVAGGLSVKESNYVRFAMESLEPMLGEKMYQRFAPDSLFRDLDAIAESHKSQPEELHPSNGLNFSIDLDI